MATYFTDDFSDFATGWTQRWDDPPGNTDWTVSAGTLYAQSASGDFCGSSVDGYDASSQHEILLKVKVSSVSQYTSVAFISGSGSAGTPSAYDINLYSVRARIYSYNGSETGTTEVSPDGGSLSADTYYWIRHGIDASGDLYGTIWQDGGSEGSPWASWSSVTPINALSGTWCGALVRGSTSTVTFDQFGIGTAGDTAPSSGGGTPVSVGLIGNSSASAVGTITASAVQNTTTALTGLSSTTAFGSLAATAEQTITHTLTGVFASSAIGTLTSNAEVNVIIGLTGNSSTTGIGTLTVLVGGGVSTALTGLSSTTALGTLSVDAANNVSVALTGNASTTALGILSVTVGTQVALSGVSSSSAIGTLIANTEQQINYPLTGLFSTGSVGTLAITVPATVSLELTGISITSGIGALSVSVPTSTDWTPVTNSETIWSDISSETIWSDISDSSTTWTEI